MKYISTIEIHHDGEPNAVGAVEYKLGDDPVVRTMSPYMAQQAGLLPGSNMDAEVQLVRVPVEMLTAVHTVLEGGAVVPAGVLPHRAGVAEPQIDDLGGDSWDQSRAEYAAELEVEQAYSAAFSMSDVSVTLPVPLVERFVGERQRYAPGTDARTVADILRPQIVSPS